MSLPELLRILRTFRLFPSKASTDHVFAFPIKVPISGTLTDKFVFELGYEAPSGAPKATFYYDLSATTRDTRFYQADATYATWVGITMSNLD